MKKLIFSILLLMLSPMLPETIEASSLIVYERADEKPTLLLYYLPWCPYCQKVLSFLKQIHKSVPLENLQKNNKGREDLQRIGGKMQVPCLIIDDYPLYESDHSTQV